MDYTINYNLYLQSKTLYDKIIIVKNKSGELVAKVALEDYLKRKYGDNFLRLEITSCMNDNMINKDFITWFGSVFGS